MSPLGPHACPGTPKYQVPHAPPGSPCPPWVPMPAVSLSLQRCWDVALAPLKQIPMNLFIMYMAGNTISIFPAMMVCMMGWRPLQALMSLSASECSPAWGQPHRDSSTAPRGLPLGVPQPLGVPTSSGVSCNSLGVPTLSWVSHSPLGVPSPMDGQMCPTVTSTPFPVPTSLPVVLPTAVTPVAAGWPGGH